jgi:hypothetical protein
MYSIFTMKRSIVFANGFGESRVPRDCQGNYFLVDACFIFVVPHPVNFYACIGRIRALMNEVQASPFVYVDTNGIIFLNHSLSVVHVSKSKSNR